MREMKESGIEWIGEIPKDWKISKIKYAINKLYSGGTPQSGNPLFYDENGYCWVAIGDMSTKPFVDDTKSRITLDGVLDKRLKLVKKGTILYSIYATIGKVSQLNIDSYINQAILALYPNEIENKTFFKYWLNSLEDYALSECSLNIQNNLNAEKVKNFPYLTISFKEQQTIANFLDEKCNEIDSLTSDIQKQIETLQEYKKSVITEAVTKGLDPNVEMKDSGSIFAGFIPKRYNFIPLKYVVDYNIESLSEKTPYNYEFDYIDIGSVTYGKGITQLQRLNFRDAPSRARRVVKEGDVILSTVRTYLKATAFIKEINFPTIVSTGFITLTAKEKINKKYLKYIAQYEGFVSEVEERSNGVSYPAINSSDVVKIKVPLPPQNDQIQIADYLDKKCSKIDLAIEEKNKQLETLEQYKKSLIYEYVTGKKEVPSYV